MKTLSYVAALATITAASLIVSGTAAIGQEGQGGMPQSSKHSQDMMEMSAMMQEPHHVLAMAYKENLVNFARALRHHAAEAKAVDPDFARAAVKEMKRSFDQMQQHHQDHMKTMDEQMKAHMADKMKQMNAHELAIEEHLTALDQAVHTSAPDSKSISEHVTAILKQCDGMSRMHSGTMEHKMN